MAPFFTNGTCDPYHPIAQPCTLGNFVSYSVNVSKPEHITQTIHFVKTHNIRLVIRNTGHDYNAKSTGAGGLALWMHNLRRIEVLDQFAAPGVAYTGPAMKMAAGVQGTQAYTVAYQRGLQIVGGECPSVGLAGGYTQGGGHSALSSRYGLGADQALEWEVIDGQGRFLIARPDNEHSDLYWALSGGGGGTYGVVWSMTVKAHPGVPVSGLNLTFTMTDSRNQGVSPDVLYKAVQAYHRTIPSIVDAGAMAISYLSQDTFAIKPLTGPDIPVSQLVDLMKPFTDALEKLGIHYDIHAEQFATYRDEFRAMQNPIPVGTEQYGSYLIPRSLVTDTPGGNEALTDAYRYIVNHGGAVTNVGLNVSRATSGPDGINAVLPAWREALFHCVVITPWDTAPAAMPAMLANQRKMTDEFIPRLRKLAPQSGAYLNEADFRQKDFQWVYYGQNYDRLKLVKGIYDPDGVFYAFTAVGSEEWEQRRDGRLCRS